MLNMNKSGYFPYTPATLMLFGLDEGIAMLHEEGLDNVFARHHRASHDLRRAAKHWGLDIICTTRSAIRRPSPRSCCRAGHDADAFRALALEQFNISYGASFGRFAAVFRIGHLGDVNETAMIGALGATELALQMAGVPIKKGGAQAAMDYFLSQMGGGTRKAAQ